MVDNNVNTPEVVKTNTTTPQEKKQKRLTSAERKTEREKRGIPETTPLHNAIMTNNLKEVKKLAQHQEAINTINSNSFTPLHVAAIMGNDKAIDILLKAGAEPSIQDDRGKTYLDIIKTQPTLENQPSLEKTSPSIAKRANNFMSSLISNITGISSPKSTPSVTEQSQNRTKSL